MKQRKIGVLMGGLSSEREVSLRSGEVCDAGGAPFVGGPLMGNPADHTIGFSPVDVTMWVAMIGALLAGIGLAMKGNLIPVRDPKLGKSLAFENF